MDAIDRRKHVATRAAVEVEAERYCTAGETPLRTNVGVVISRRFSTSTRLIFCVVFQERAVFSYLIMAGVCCLLRLDKLESHSVMNVFREPDRHWSSVDEIVLPEDTPDSGEYVLPTRKPFGPEKAAWSFGPARHHRDSFYCTHISGVQRLQNGNTLSKL